MAEQRAVPMLSYEDVGTAIDWLSSAFGFRESGERYTDDEGRVTHAQLELDGAAVMLGWPGPDYRGRGGTRRSASRRGSGSRCRTSWTAC
jgi:uncharacterized glyoxalase superfamily protein PhnB